MIHRSPFKFSVLFFVGLFFVSYSVFSDSSLTSKYDEARSQFQNGKYARSNETLFSLIEEAKLNKEYNVLGNALFLRAYNCVELLQSDSALIAFYDSQDVYARSGNEVQYANVTNNIAHLFLKNRTYDIAQKYYEMGAELSKGLRDKRLLSDSYYSLGYCSRMMGDFMQAYIYFEKALEVEIDLESPKGLANIYLDQGVCQFKLKNYSIASDLFWKSLKIGKTNDLGEIIGMSYNHIADCKVLQGNIIDAETYYDLAIESLPENSMNKTIVTTNKANLQYQKGDFPSAINLYAKALEGEPNTVDMGDAYVAYDSLLAYFDATGQGDSALLYSKKMNDITRYVNEQKQKLNAADGQFALRAMYTSRLTEERLAKKRKEQLVFFGLMTTFLLLTAYLFWMLKKRSFKGHSIIKENAKSLAYINSQIEADKRKLN